MSLRVHSGTGNSLDGPSLSYFERRGGEPQMKHLEPVRAKILADATLPYSAGSFQRALHLHPAELSGMNAEHIDATTFAQREHQRRMEILGVEHEIEMAHITSQAKQTVPAGRNQHHLREWNLSAIDSIQAQQHADAIQRAEDAIANRKKMALGELQKEAAAAAVKTKEDSLKRLKEIERNHRLKMMELDEEKLKLQNEDVGRAVKEEHDFVLANMQQKHERQMEMLKAQHASRMAQISTVSQSATSTMPADDEAPPREFGVATAQFLWSLGMPDNYVEDHNLAKKLETALTCVAAERPSDPAARLAELLK
jgi:hypothetical protein